MRNVRGNTSVISHRNPRRALNGNKPRQIADGVCFIFCPTSGRTLCMGFHPLFRLNFRRRSGFLVRALAPHQAKPGTFSGGVSSIKEPPVTGFTRRDSGLRLRATIRRQEIRSPPDRSRFSNDADPRLSSRNGRLKKVAAAVAIFSLGFQSVRPIWRGVNTKPSQKYFVKLERIKNRLQTDWRPIPISTESLIRSAVRATPNFDLMEVAVLATVL